MQKYPWKILAETDIIDYLIAARKDNCMAGNR